MKVAEITQEAFRTLVSIEEKCISGDSIYGCAWRETYHVKGVNVIVDNCFLTGVRQYYIVDINS